MWLILAFLAFLLVTMLARGAPCWGVLLISLVVAYPLWRSLHESSLFNRRLLLTGATREGCLTRRWLWGGRIGAALRVLPAVIMALLVLTFAMRLNAHQWAILLFDALLLAVLYGVMQRQATSQIHEQMLGPYVRGWPLRWLNLGGLTLAFFALTFFVLGAPDLRQATWQTVAEQAFHAGREGVACPWIGWLVGTWEYLEQGSWALAQRYIPGLPSVEWRLAAWLLFLLQLSLFALLYTRLLLGVLTLIESRQLRVESVTGDSALSKTFILTILILAMPTFYAALRLQDLDPSQFATPAQKALNVVDPCHDRLAPPAEIVATLSTEQVQLNEAIAQRIDAEVERIFVPIEAAVDDYLDWYFTVVGEYERLAALIVGDFPQLLAAQLESHLFEATDFHAQLHTLEQTLFQDTLTQLAGVSQMVQDQIAAQAAADPCVRFALNPAALSGLERDVWRAGVAVGSGVAVAATTTAVLSQKVVAAVMAKVAAKKSMQTAAVVAAKLAAKKGGGAMAAAVGAAAVCAPSGPWALVCGLGAGVATWLAVDKIAIEIEESVSRQTMREEILEVLDEEKEALKEALRQQQTMVIGALVEQIKTTADGVFIPARDGL
ncbi:hypothetical protein CKO25_11425 [Thiocapsa imhoffii]|uniref:Uncharacterized protein n=2 Tax=Thiocapsa imhoffii TaxID=382777 RepID=A0A9X0WI95_9GAMM|nr:hypothetical protein [Thiocapsa imhoffii]